MARPHEESYGGEERLAFSVGVLWNLQDAFVVRYSRNIGRADEFETILNVAKALSYAEDITFLFIGSEAKQAWIMREVYKRGLRNVSSKPYQLSN